MNYGEREHLLKSLNAGLRYDGRALEDLRNIEIETNIITTAEGSARVKVGKTEVLAGVKLSVGTPYGDRPNDGVLMVGCELLPLAHTSLEMGPPSINAIEIGRVIDRGIRESGCVDTSKLCIEEGKKVWIISVDIVPLNHDGNLIDIGAIAALAAIKTAKFPTLKEDGTVDYKKMSNNPLIVEEEPIAITIGKIGEHLIVDPTYLEDEFLDARLTVTVMKDDKFCSLQKNGIIGLSVDEVEKIFDLAIEKSKVIRALMK